MVSCCISNCNVSKADNPNNYTFHRFTKNKRMELANLHRRGITNLDSLLQDIYLRFIKLQQFPLHYQVFDVVFNDLHAKMKENDPYYKKYSSTIHHAGSHYDNLRIHKPDEFDMYIVIDYFKTDDIRIEQMEAGYIKLKMFKNFPKKDLEESKPVYDWMDNSNYLLRSKFIEWFEGVVAKAINRCKVNNNQQVVNVEGVPYTIKVSKSGPAITLLIRNHQRNFKMDVDLVPALRFSESRWPVSKSYRGIPAKCRKGYWIVVPKPNKQSPIWQDQSRSWRLSLQHQERELMYNSYNLRQTIRLIKKLRDAQSMNKIASYYIKTLFFWEIVEVNNEHYWRSSIAVLFKRMVGKLHAALVEGRIPYFWNSQCNFIGDIPRHVLDQYANIVGRLRNILEHDNQYKLVAKYLLTQSEYDKYNTL